ncbi:hypothetical protein F0562_013263 [Nyssa sinensis]|uniref:MBD domain-containing protein n=1 Tax=Nyssa sinensis TaxID=561372 RepID=A0A5J4ZX50_9ASTE|nr:hypothetical protein F0562_013263 [Nyssa sinensis]
MVAEKSPDWLPAGWTVQVKVKNGRKVRCYFNGETGQKFHSKSDIIRYVKMGNVRVHQPINKHKKRPSKKKAVPLAAKTNEYPEWLPHGWTMEVKTRKAGSRIGMKYKCYIDPSTGCKFFSKPEVSRYLKSAMCDDSTSKQKKIDIGSVSNHCNDQLNGGKSSLKPELSQNLKTIKGKSFTSKQKKESIDKHSVKNVVVERVPPDGLPPGWIKEIRIQKKVNGIRKDPYYTDPVSGYVFRSQKDALRYLETGDINRCAIKPKKRDVSDVEMKNDELSPQSVGKGHKLRHHTTRRQLFAGKESFDTSSLAASDAEGSKDGQRKAVCTDVMGTSTLTAEILEGKHLIDNVIGDNAETKAGPDPGSSALPTTKGSKRKRGKRTLAEDGSVSTPAANILQEENLPENGTEEFSNTRTQIGSSKRKNKNAVILPSRSSKRLAGLKPELVANLGLSERALRAATKKSGESEDKPSLGFTLDGEPDGALQQLEAEPEIEIAHHASGRYRSSIRCRAIKQK